MRRTTSRTTVGPTLLIVALVACSSSAKSTTPTAPIPVVADGQTPAQPAVPQTDAVGLPALTQPPPTTEAVATTVAQIYIVQAGDQLKRIAKKFGVSLNDLLTVNNIANADKIREGQKLIIPAPTAPGETAAPAPSGVPRATATTVKP